MKSSRLTKKQFEILTILEKEGVPLTQREIADLTGYALGSVNQNVKELTERECINYGAITRKGRALLEIYRVKRVIILADDFKPRMMPISLKTPMALVKVHGKRLIDRLIDATIRAEIEEIYIVCGYLKEQFDVLLKKYPMIKVIENPFFNETNSISSLMCARHLLKNVYVCEVDLLLKNPNVFNKYQYNSNFLGIPVKRTDDWCFETNKKTIISQKIGGELPFKGNYSKITDLYQKVGISYWTEDDGIRLAEHIEQVYEMPGGKERYWDQAPFEFFKKEYQVEIRTCQKEDVVKIDTFDKFKMIEDK